MRLAGALAATLVAGVACCGLRAADTPPEQALRDHVPKPGEFPPAGAGVQTAGDLVVVDPMNRRGGLRIDRGPGTPEKRLFFQMLPYGMARYHGAPAELRDIPPGTHVHVRLLLPPEAEKDLVPPLSEEEAKNPANRLLRYTHALEIEDDFSFYSRRGRAWKVVALEPGVGLKESRFELTLDPEGPAVEGGVNERMNFVLDTSTRIWKERRLVSRDAIEPGQIVQVNLTWSMPNQKQEYGITDLWLDEESRAAFTELQRENHLMHQKSRFVPGWVDAVENGDTGRGVVTVTLFGGMDPSLYEELETAKDKVLQLTVAEPTLRTWLYHQENAPRGNVVSWSRVPEPPPGSSGIQLKLDVELRQGFMPGRVVRAKRPGWIYVLLPHDEWLMSEADLQKASKWELP
ncbi:MAG: hypothetical protein O3A18_01600 [Planctomycetota bacterium]|nr:hypothetical protein [Planctomycetota bacterium]